MTNKLLDYARHDLRRFIVDQSATGAVGPIGPAEMLRRFISRHPRYAAFSKDLRDVFADYPSLFLRGKVEAMNVHRRDG